MHGNSITAGRSVVLQTVLSRGMFIPMPVLLLPHAIMQGLARLRMVPKNPRLKLGLEVRERSAAWVAPILLGTGLLDRQSTHSLTFQSIHKHAQLSVITGSLAFALPVAMSLFPQQAAFKASELEPQFRNLKDGRGR